MNPQNEYLRCQHWWRLPTHSITWCHQDTMFWNPYNFVTLSSIYVCLPIISWQALFVDILARVLFSTNVQARSCAPSKGSIGPCHIQKPRNVFQTCLEPLKIPNVDLVALNNFNHCVTKHELLRCNQPNGAIWINFVLLLITWLSNNI